MTETREQLLEAALRDLLKFVPRPKNPDAGPLWQRTRYQAQLAAVTAAEAALAAAVSPKPSEALRALAVAASEAEERASAALGELCEKGPHSFTMSIPADPKRDHDLIIGDALAALRKLCAALLRQPAAPASEGERYDLTAHLHRQRAFSQRAFGPGARVAGVVDHIRKELREIEADPGDLTEWIDVVLLALDGAWRQGNEPEAIVAALEAKLTKNEQREWPDWRTADPDKAIEHVRAASSEGSER